MTTAQLSSSMKSVSRSAALDPKALASMIKLRWKRGEKPDARQAVEENTALRHAKSLQLDLAYEEYCLRRETGEVPDLASFCSRFPSLQASLRRLLEAHQVLEEHPELFENDMPSWPEVGSTYLGFDLLEELGRGAFARVYLAREQALGNRLVALKVAPRGSAEAETLGRLRHPNIVPVYSVQREPGTAMTAVCMPYLGRATLCDMLDHLAAAPTIPSRARSLLDAVATASTPGDPADPLGRQRSPLEHCTYVEGVMLLGAQLAEALAFAHSLGIHHRDLKPSNVLLTSAGEPLLLDFNLAYDVRSERQCLGGTLPYMAPEQLLATDPMGSGDDSLVGPQADLFSLGVLIYELLTGVHPFGPLPAAYTQASLRSLLMERHRRGPRSAPPLKACMDSELALLIEQCLAFEVSARPNSAAEVAASFRRLLTPLRRSRRWLKQRTPVLLICGGLLLAAASGGAMLSSGSVTESEAAATTGAASSLDLGRQAYSQQRHLEAIAHFNRALGQTETAAAYFSRARAIQQLAGNDSVRLGAALADYQHANDLQPSPKTRACMAYCLTKMDKPQLPAAAAYFEKCLEDGLVTAEILNNLGCIYSQDTAHLTEAQALLDRAVALNPELQAARHNRALVSYQQAIAPAFGRKLNADTRAEAQRKLLLAAAEDIERAISMGPTSAELHRDAARIYARLGKIDSKWQEQALRQAALAVQEGFDPEKLRADAALAHLNGLPRFVQLARKVPDAQPSRAARLVDPLAGALE